MIRLPDLSPLSYAHFRLGSGYHLSFARDSRGIVLKQVDDYSYQLEKTLLIKQRLTVSRVPGRYEEWLDIGTWTISQAKNTYRSSGSVHKSGGFEVEFQRMLQSFNITP